MGVSRMVNDGGYEKWLMMVNNGNILGFHVGGTPMGGWFTRKKSHLDMDENWG